MKRILYALLTIALVMGLVGGGYFAYFRDTETSTANTFTAGFLDLEIDCAGDTVFSAQSEPLPLIFDYLPVGDNHIQPGDSGEVTISLHMLEGSLPADMWMEISNLEDFGGSNPEPEVSGDDQISDDILTTVWLDTDGNNRLDDGETVIKNGTMETLATVGKFPVRYNAKSNETYYVGWSWEFPNTVGNELQGDYCTFDIAFGADQVTKYPLTAGSTGQGSVLGIGTYDPGTVVPVTAVPATGWRFLNWTEGGSNPKDIIMDGPKHVTANFAINQYTISFNSNGGSSVADIMQDYGTAVTAPTPPIRVGYTFAGWSPAVPATMPVGGAALTAQWTAINYTVTFDKNGGDTDAVPTTRSAIYNGTVTLPTAPTKVGSTFNGWNTLANGTGSAFTGSTAVTADATVYAQWTAINYTVTFDKNGGDTDAVPTTRSAIYNGTVTLPTAPTKVGFTFNGWNTLANGTGSAFTGSTAVTADATVYAQWTAINYTVTFDKNGGDTDAVPTTRSAIYNGTVTLPTAPTKVGSTFNGWNTLANGTGSAFTGSTAVTADATVYAQWTAINYTVTFDKNGGDTDAVPTTRSAIYNGTVTLPTAPTKVGSTFNGWNTLANGTGSAFTGSTAVTADVTVYAQWTAINYTVTFDKNGGDTDAVPTTRSAIYNGTVTLPTAPTKVGFTFNGWNTLANGTGSAFTGSTAVTADATVYAQWTAINYTVTFDKNGGDTDAVPTTRSAIYNGTVTLPTAPTKVGSTFNGWNTLANGTGSAFTGSTAVTADATVYAQWTAINYTVTFDKNGGDTDAVPTTRSAIYNGTVTLPTAPTKVGSTFNGWNTLANGTGSAFTGSTAVTADATVYAQWTAINYTVTFDKNGGDTDAVPTTRSAIYNGTVTLPTAPTKVGFTFNGWNTLANGTGSAFTGSTAVTADATVYAQWTAINYTVTFDKNGGDTDAVPTTRSAIYNGTVTLPTAPTKVGSTFNGWNTLANGTGSAFTGSTAVTADVTVYAQWTAINYTVTFDKNGGDTDAVPTTRSAIYNGTVTLPTAPTKVGSTFNGWNTLANGTGSAFTGSTAVTADVTVYAQWTQTNIALTVTGITASNKVYDGGVVAALNMPPGTPADSGARVASAYANSTFNPISSAGNAYTSNNVYGIADNGGDSATYSNFGFSIPSNATINGIQVTSEAHRDSTSTRTFNIDLSWNGSSFTSTQPTGDFGSSDTTRSIGSSTTIPWGGSHAWVPGDFSNANFRVRYAATSGGDNIYLDYFTVTVYYTPVGTPTLVGVLPGDDVTLNTAGAAGAFNNRNVGAGKTVTVSGMVLGGADAGKYTLTQPTTTASITPRPITVTAVADTKAYDGNTSSDGVPTITLGTLGTGDPAPSWTQTFNTASAGTGKTLAPSGSVADGNGGNNYAVTFVNNTTGVITTDTGWRSPTIFGNSGVGSPGNVATADDQYAGFDNGNDYETCRSFGFSIPSGSTIYGIEVSIEGYVTSSDIPRTFDTSLSWDGSNLSSYKTNTNLGTTADGTVVLGSASDLWGSHPWTRGDINSTNFTVRIDADIALGSLYIDHIKVRVTYAP